MQSFDTFWSVIAQSVLVLGFALVAEVRASVKNWKYEERLRRVAAALIYTILGVALIIILNVSLVQMSGGTDSEWLRTVVINVISSAAMYLVANPVIIVATSGNADLFLLIVTIRPRLQRRWLRHRIRRYQKKVSTIRRKTYGYLIRVRTLRSSLDLLDSGRPLSPGQFDAAVSAFARLPKMTRASARRMVIGWGKIEKANRDKVREYGTGLERAAVERLRGQANTIRDMTDALAKGPAFLNDEAQKGLRAIFEQARNDLN